METNPEHARAIAREHLSMYLRAPNYANNWLRLGFTPDDITNGGSGPLVDALVWANAMRVSCILAGHSEDYMRLTEITRD